MVGGSQIHLISVHIIPQNFVAFQHVLGAPTNKNIHPVFTLQSEGDMSAKLIETSSLFASEKTTTMPEGPASAVALPAKS